MRAAPTTPRTLPAPVTGEGGPSAAGRWIVMLRGDAGVKAARPAPGAWASRRSRVQATRSSGYSAKLDGRQFATLRADPKSWRSSLTPGSGAGPSTPRGVRRVFGTKSPIAKIDGVDERVDADVAIFDTGIDKSNPDLNVVGG